ncbi:MAG TPA: cobalamin-independent methionine synthase II family protein [Planctomycetota bacterium]|nr:cobalamin-independent methionine synthase II family protein [Planctomycetota bacterium]
MPRPIPLFPTSVVGSWPRPRWLLEATRKRAADLADLRRQAVLLAIKEQEDAGIDVLTDGEQARDNFYSFLTEKLDGVTLMTMADLLDHVEDKAAFEGLLQALDVPAYAIKNPTITGRLVRRQPLAATEAAFLLAHTTRATKVTLPGPYLLSRSMWVQKLSAAAYPTREALCDDIVAILRAELQELGALGVDVVQFDEPVLTELVFAGKGSKRTFMCAALAAASDPAAELQLAVHLINRVVDGVRGVRTALHVCRGNWSRNEDVLLSGDYAPLLPHLARMQVDQFVLEYATPRAGPESLLAQLPARCQIGFGAVNPRTEPDEDPAAIAARVRELAALLGPARIWLNPDCGFGTFADRPVATAEVAAAKCRTLAAAARTLRKGPAAS